MDELRGKIAFAIVHLNAISQEIEAAAIAGVIDDDPRERYQKMMRWAMGVRSYTEFLDKIYPGVDRSNK